jgi:integrase
MTPTANPSERRPRPERPRSLPVTEWPDADRRGWEAARQAGSRLRPGGSASYLAKVSQDDFAGRYGAFMGFLQRGGRLDLRATAAAQVTPQNVDDYITDLMLRVRSVTVCNCIYKLRRAAELLAPNADFSWLAEIEKDLALVMEPRSKYHRLVSSRRIVEAGLTLMVEAQQFAKSDVARALGIRNGLMIAVLGFCPIRLKNFAALQIGTTFKEISGSWWITVPREATKTRRCPEERRVPELLNHWIDIYLKQSRPILLRRSRSVTNALWISSRTGTAMTYKNLGSLISKITRKTLGVDVSPHLFRTAAASTAAAYGGNTPHLASALLNHTDPRVTEDHYIRASAIRASNVYASIVRGYLEGNQDSGARS